MVKKNNNKMNFVGNDALVVPNMNLKIVRNDEGVVPYTFYNLIEQKL